MFLYTLVLLLNFKEIVGGWTIEENRDMTLLPSPIFEMI